MRLAFLGSGAFGLPTLEALARAHDVVMVVTQPDRKAGRGGTLTPTPIGAWAVEHLPSVPLLKPERINEPGVLEQVRAVEADAWVVIAFGQKLSQSLLADRFAINLHASLLPRWRGAAPINAAILAGDATTGNSVITLADRMDAGLVLGQSGRPIEPAATAGELHDLLATDGPGLVIDVLSRHRARMIIETEQDEAKVTLAPKLSRADGWVDFTKPAEACRQRINGLSPWPGVQATLDGLQLKLVRARVWYAGDPHDPRDPHHAAPGTLLDPTLGLFACGGDTLQLIDLQPTGKRPMAWADFARGRSPKKGCVLQSVGGPAPC